MGFIVRINLNKGMILGIAGGITVFILILIFIMYNQSDFDQNLIYQVEQGVPADKLIPQIDKETENLRTNALRRFESKVINKNYGTNLASQDEYQSYQDTYQNEMKMISVYDDARKKFAMREINKEQFLQDIKAPKELLQMLQ